MTAIITMSNLPRQIALDFDAGVTMYCKGRPGMGKTTFFKDYALAEKKKGPFFYGVLNASTAVLPDVVGYLFPTQETVGGQTFTAGTYTYPYFFRDDVTGEPAFMFARGILVVDEYDKASPDVKRALAIVQEEKRVGAHHLPDGIMIVLLGNRAQDRSGSTRDFDFCINRRGEYELQPDLDSWISWAVENDVTPTTMAFAAANPTLVMDSEVPKEQGPWCTFRSLVKADDFIKAAARQGVDPTDETYLPGIASKVGASCAAQMTAFVRLQHTLPKFEAILANPETTPVPEKDPSACMILAYQLGSRATKENVTQIVTYMQRLPESFGVAFIKVTLRKDPYLISTRAVGAWAAKNSDLIAAVS
jgi:hypothetical protein